MKAFFGKIWAWIVAHKLIAGIIAGVTVVVLTVAIVVPVSVSVSKKKKAAEEETQETTPQDKEEDKGGEHVHQWGAPKFTWNDDNTASAEFVCTLDPTHVHVENAVITSEVTNATCTNAGATNYTATVNFGGQEHKSYKEVPIDPTGVHVINDYGFCSECGVYQGVDDLLDTPISTGELVNGTTIYKRFEVVQLHTYQLTFTGWQGSELSTFYRNSTDNEFVELDREGGKFTMPDENSFDGYLYLVGEATGSAPTSSITVSLFAHNNLFPATGYCKDDGLYGGFTVGIGQSATAISIYAGQNGFIRFPIQGNHSYKFQDKTGDIWYQQFTQVFTRDPLTKELTHIDTDKSEQYWVKTRQIETNEIGDGYLYLVVQASGADRLGVKMNVIEIHHYNYMGLCACMDYDGVNLLEFDVYDVAEFNGGTSIHVRYVVTTDYTSVVVRFPYDNYSTLHYSPLCEVYLMGETYDTMDICFEGDSNYDFMEFVPYSSYFSAGDEIYIIISNEVAETIENLEVSIQEYNL